MPKRTTRPVADLPSRFLTAQDLADLLAVPVQTVYQWRYLGSGPPGFRVGRYLRYDPVAVRRWIDARTDDPDGQAA